MTHQDNFGIKQPGPRVRDVVRFPDPEPAYRRLAALTQLNAVREERARLQEARVRAAARQPEWSEEDRRLEASIRARGGSSALSEGRSGAFTVRDGLALPYNEETYIGLSAGVGYVERFAVGSLTDFLGSGPDIMLLAHHNRELLMARTSNHTLRVKEDVTGLRFSADATDTSYSRDIASLRDAGTLTGVSFAFVPDPRSEVWDETTVQLRSGEVTTLPRVTIRSVALLDEISPVSRPAYKTTHLGR